jgi:hypothetical protein
MLVGAIGLVTAAPIIIRIARRRFDPFEPIVFFSVAYGIMFVARPAYMLVTRHLTYDGPRIATDVSPGFSRMLAVALLGAAAFTLAYELPLGRRLGIRRRTPGELTEPRVVFWAVVTGLLGLAGVVSFLAAIASSSGVSGLWLIVRGRSTQLSHEGAAASFYVWYSFLLLIPATLVLLAVGLARRGKALLLTAFFFATILLLRTAPLGTRSALLPLLGALFVFHYIRRDARPSPLVLVVLPLVALVGSSFLSDLRGRATRDETVIQTVVRSTRPSRIASPFLAGPDSEMAPALAAALMVIPREIPYSHGRTIIGDLVARPVPRRLWLSKPVPPREKLISALWPVERDRSGIHPEFSVLLYFFWDFGWYGVALGMALFGILWRAIFEYFLTHKQSLAAQVLYALVIWFMVIGLRNSPVDTFVEFVFVVLPVWLALEFSLRRTIATRPARVG